MKNEIKLPSNVEINDRARPEEIIAMQYLLKYVFLNDERLVLGDCFENREPDIFLKDHSVGIDVVRIEEDIDFIYDKFVTLCDENDMDFDKCLSILRNSFSHYPFLIHKSGDKVVKTVQRTGQRAPDYYVKPLLVNFEKKFSKLNGGNYSACEENRLFVFSSIKSKSERDIKNYIKIFNYVASRYNKKFSTLYVVTKDTFYVYEINNYSYEKHARVVFNVDAQNGKDDLNK